MHRIRDISAYFSRFVRILYDNSIVVIKNENYIKIGSSGTVIVGSIFTIKRIK